MKHLILSTALLFVAGQAVWAETPREAHRATLERADIGSHGIAYLDLGDPRDPAVMLLHGIPTSSYLYRDVAPQIAAAGYRVIAPDLLGHGASDRPVDMAAYATDARASRMFELADTLGVEDFALVLHDIGGMTGWAMVGQAPERLSAVVATNTLAGLDGVTPAPLVMQMMSGQLSPMDAFADLDDPTAAREMAQMWMDQGYSGPGTAPAEEVDAYGADLVGAGTAYTAFFGVAVPAFMQSGEALAADLAAYDGPTAIIFGEQDGFFAPDIVIADLAAKLGTKEEHITRLPEAGHFLQAQAPATYVAALTDFLDANLEN